MTISRVTGIYRGGISMARKLDDNCEKVLQTELIKRAVSKQDVILMRSNEKRRDNVELRAKRAEGTADEGSAMMVSG